MYAGEFESSFCTTIFLLVRLSNGTTEGERERETSTRTEIHVSGRLYATIFIECDKLSDIRINIRQYFVIPMNDIHD